MAQGKVISNQKPASVSLKLIIAIPMFVRYLLKTGGMLSPQPRREKTPGGSTVYAVGTVP